MRPTTLADLSVELLDLELTEPFAIATGAQSQANNLLVRVTLADGTVGLGEAAPFPDVSGETQEGARATVEAARQLLAGVDARAWRPLGARLTEEFPAQPAARCGIEMAMLDALTRHYQVPLWAFFGGAGTTVETDMTVTAGDLDHARVSARAIVARGINTLKVKVGARGPEADAERMVAIHRVAPHARLTADANGGYSVEQARVFLTALEDAAVPLALFEQPVSAEEPRALAEVARHAKVPICADESARSAADVLRLVRDGSAHAINLKLMKCGVTETLAMWAIARAAGLQLMIGGMVESLLAMSFSAHLAAGLGGFGYVDLDTPMFIRIHPFRGGFQQTGGLLNVGHVERGHGVELG